MHYGGLLALLAAEAGVGVDNLDVQLGSTVDDHLAVARRDVRGDLGGVLSVVHQEQLEVLDVVDDELEETVGQQVTGLLVRAITDLGHGSVALEAATHSVINTSGLAP